MPFISQSTHFLSNTKFYYILWPAIKQHLPSPDPNDIANFYNTINDLMDELKRKFIHETVFFFFGVRYFLCLKKDMACA